MLPGALCSRSVSTRVVDPPYPSERSTINTLGRVPDCVCAAISPLPSLYPLPHMELPAAQVHEQALHCCKITVNEEGGKIEQPAQPALPAAGESRSQQSQPV